MPGSRTKRQPFRPPYPDLNDYWQDQIRTLGRNIYFVETGGILKTLEADDVAIDFFANLYGIQLLTSTYVLAETVRRIVKAKHPERFAGPSGERGGQLAIHLLSRWLSDNNVEVICPPRSVFDVAIKHFSACRGRGIECDLADVISYVIVDGLGQRAIISPDRHFQSMGLQLLPGPSL